MTRFKNQFNFIKNIDFKKKWIILSDSNDYVMYNDVSDPEFPVASLVKSKTIADMERARFKCFSDKSRNF